MYIVAGSTGWAMIRACLVLIGDGTNLSVRHMAFLLLCSISFWSKFASFSGDSHKRKVVLVPATIFLHMYWCPWPMNHGLLHLQEGCFMRPVAMSVALLETASATAALPYVFARCCLFISICPISAYGSGYRAAIIAAGLLCMPFLTSPTCINGASQPASQQTIIRCPCVQLAQ